MKADGKRLLITSKGYTVDIVNEISTCFGLYWTQCRDLAVQLKGRTERQTCQNIFQYVVDNVRYREDGDEQQIKTPARLLSDGVGDCKSMSLFVASCLRCLDIPAVFRYVSFAADNVPTHVYVVTGSGIVIDPVERVSGQPRFDYARPYTHKQDIDIMQPTTISRLTGIADGSRYGDYAAVAEPAMYSTKALNFINSEIALHVALLQSYTDRNERIEIMNYLDFLFALKDGYKRYYQSNNELVHLCSILSEWWDSKYFGNLDTDEYGRLAVTRTRIAQVHDEVARRMRANMSPSNITSDTFKFLAEHVLKNNRIEATSEQRRQYERAIAPDGKISGITDDQRRQLERDFRKTGTYYTYSFIDDKFIDDNDIKTRFPRVYKKRIEQQKMRRIFAENVSSVFDQRTIDNMLLQGAIQDNDGKQPQELIKNTIKNKSKIGIAPAVAAAIILWAKIVTSCAIALTAVIALVKTIFGRSQVTSANIRYGKADETDFDTYLKQGNRNNILGGGSLPALPLIVGACFVGYLLLRNKNNDTK